jgi:hypothetical protein
MSILALQYRKSCPCGPRLMASPGRMARTSDKAGRADNSCQLMADFVDLVGLDRVVVR